MGFSQGFLSIAPGNPRAESHAAGGGDLVGGPASPEVPLMFKGLQVQGLPYIPLGFRVLGFRGLGFRVSGLGFRACSRGTLHPT